MVDHITPIPSAGVSMIAEAIAAAEKALRRYHGATVRMEGEAIELDYTADFDRLKVARQVLDTKVSTQQHKDIVGALEYASINMAVGDEMEILSGGPAGEKMVSYADALAKVANALIKGLGRDRRHPKPGAWLYSDPIGGPPQVVQVRDSGGELVAVFQDYDDEGAEVPVADLSGDFEPV